MNTTELQSALLNKFAKKRLVFWHDAEQEFADTLEELELGDVSILQMEEFAALELKIRLEKECSTEKFLLYSKQEEPEFHDDWLYDIRLYSESFCADRASLLLSELGLSRLELKSEIAARKKFFANRKRMEALAALTEAEDSAEDLKLKMLAVLAGAKRPEFLVILRQLFASMSSDEEVELDVIPNTFKQFETYDLESYFWEQVKLKFALDDKCPSLKNLLVRIFVSDFAESVSSEAAVILPEQLSVHLFEPVGRRAAAVFLDHWRDSSKDSESYNLLASAIASELDVGDFLSNLSPADLRRSVTFLEVDRALVGVLAAALCKEQIDAAEALQIGSERQALHWATSPSRTDEERKNICAAYRALSVAAKFGELRLKYRNGFSFDSAADGYSAYVDSLYKFDQLYRHFCENVRTFHDSHSFSRLQERIEQQYLGWFVGSLETAWGAVVEKELLKDWQIEGVGNQHQFFKKHVDSYVRPATKRGTKSKQTRRAFVIISDGLRYEAAEELRRSLNSKYRFKAELASQLSVLPSYTQLGMAALLPWDTLEFKDDECPSVNGRSAKGLAARSRILEEKNGIALKCDELLKLSKEEGRSAIAGKDVVYIYHNDIDATGDEAKKENQTFEAVDRSIKYLSNLVKYLINSLNASHVLVTADHGFFYSETQAREIDRSRLGDAPGSAVKTNKRFLLGRQLPDNDEVWHGNTKTTALASGDMEFWVPKGASRFYFTGGARYFHGGAMPQEVVVPVLTVREENVKSKKARTQSKVVKVQLINGSPKITAQSHRFEFIQMEPVSDRVLPLVGKISIVDEGRVVSSIESMSFSSRSESLDERTQSVVLTLMNEEFDKNKTYKLLVKDEDDIVRLSVDVKIDRVINDDFGF